MSEELKCLSPRKQILTKKLMHDALNNTYRYLKKFEDDEKHLCEYVDGF